MGKWEFASVHFKDFEVEEKHKSVTNQIVSWVTYLEESGHLHSVRGKGEQPGGRVD